MLWSKIVYNMVVDIGYSPQQDDNFTPASEQYALQTRQFAGLGGTLYDMEGTINMEEPKVKLSVSQQSLVKLIGACGDIRADRVNARRKKCEFQTNVTHRLSPSSGRPLPARSASN